MAHTTTWRARAALLTATGLAALTLIAACGTSGNGNGQPTGGTGNLGGTPTGGQATTPAASDSAGQPTATQATTGGGGNTQQAPLYPTNAKDYATAMLTAYGTNDHDRLVVLAASNVPDYLAGQPQLVGPWTYMTCTNDATQSCYFYNPNGVGIMVGVAKNLLGHPQAVVFATQTSTVVPNTPCQYLNDFMSAWQNKDYYGMMALSTSSALTFFNGRQPGTSGLGLRNVSCIDFNAMSGKHTVTIETIGGSYYCSWSVVIDNDLATQHKLHAIGSAKLPTPCVTA